MAGIKKTKFHLLAEEQHSLSCRAINTLTDKINKGEITNKDVIFLELFDYKKNRMTEKSTILVNNKMYYRLFGEFIEVPDKYVIPNNEVFKNYLSGEINDEDFKDYLNF